MAYHTTILRQIIDIFPRYEFESLARDYHVGQIFRSCNRWTQFMVMLIGQHPAAKACGIGHERVRADKQVVPFGNQTVLQSDISPGRSKLYLLNQEALGRTDMSNHSTASCETNC